MEADQLPVAVREFTDYLRGLLARLDRSAGWCAVFWQRDPDGMRACLDGREPPPWDVLEALLQDLAATYGPAAATETPTARALHLAALDAYDARPGARDALRDRLDVMLREQRYAAERRAELTHRLASAATREEADALGPALAWADDDHRRATARCAEITARVTSLDRREGQAARVPTPQADPSAASGRPGNHPTAPGTLSPGRPGPGGHRPAPERGGGSAPGAVQPAPAPGQRRRRRGGARFAGAAEEADGPVAVPPAAVPSLPAAAPAARGARFAGAAGAAGEEPPRSDRSGQGDGGGRRGPSDRTERGVDGADRREAGRIVGALARLRSEGRSGEAHAVLVEAAHWPAARFPLLAHEMRRAGLGADWATLLWEAAASLPADRLVAAADALTAAGRAQDAEQILRQGVVRPVDEIGRAVLALTGEERHREVRALLDACVRMRTPEDAARTAAPDPQRLVPLLLAAARDVSDERHWDLLHALRVAGFAA
ncbi:hypothetical protein [Streptomyces griseoloalbus]|uniref:UL36 very large tegument protein n=1 Tax=Streptomyces griseoloalbus TaxID=67303 RepID=A0A7W8F7K1_9ACTN|nr:hypothetical protein [Streptomyces albaduncus]MBB5126168.1 hypothetical protein [Streptomyces albaduncus]GGW36908.1 hypothetical protein GCM10010340_13470 [Streptomyces albaduncus]